MPDNPGGEGEENSIPSSRNQKKKRFSSLQKDEPTRFINNHRCKKKPQNQDAERDDKKKRPRGRKKKAMYAVFCQKKRGPSGAHRGKGSRGERKNEQANPPTQKRAWKKKEHRVHERANCVFRRIYRHVRKKRGNHNAASTVKTPMVGGKGGEKKRPCYPRRARSPGNRVSSILEKKKRASGL